MENNAITEQLFFEDSRYSIVTGARSYVVTVMENSIPGERFEIKYDNLSVLIIRLIQEGFVEAGFEEEWFRKQLWSGSTFMKEEKDLWFLISFGYIKFSHREEEPSPITNLSYWNYFYIPTFKTYWKNYLIHNGKGLNPFV